MNFRASLVLSCFRFVGIDFQWIVSLNVIVVTSADSTKMVLNKRSEGERISWKGSKLLEKIWVNQPSGDLQLPLQT